MHEADEMADVYLLPGEVHLAHKPTIIRTILGSCVAVSFWSPRLGVGALSHSLLPKCPPGSSPQFSLATGHRYVDFSVRELARQIDALGALRTEVQIKMFGGADVLLVSDASSSSPTVGKLNCDAAIEIVRAEGFSVIASSLGGTLGRNIQFNTATGEVRLRWLE